MDIEVKVIKGIPKEQISKFEDRVVYYTAIATREYVKGKNGYPYLTGRLQRSEIAAPILEMNKEYSLTTGVNYAKAVWNYTNVNWTNPSTMPKWYLTAFQKSGATLTLNAVLRAMKEIK